MGGYEMDYDCNRNENTYTAEAQFFSLVLANGSLAEHM
jgi:hypothetical protein